MTIISPNRNPPRKCVECGRNMIIRGHSTQQNRERLRAAPAGTVIHGGRGFCQGCYNRLRARGAFTTAVLLAPHGTVAAYRRHYAEATEEKPAEPCGPCRDAKRRSDRERAAKRRAVGRRTATAETATSELLPGTERHAAAVTAGAYALAYPDPGDTLELFLTMLGLRVSST
jgi:hypothetical protein